MIAKHDLGLSTGHVSAEEALMVIRAAKAAGVNKIRHNPARFLGLK